MSEQLNQAIQLNLQDEGLKSRYINPKTDFAFKLFFGKEPHKDLLIDFLNGIFKGRKVVIDLEYNNSDHKGILPAYRKTVFDLYCTGDNGERFIVEMQQAKREFFKDRIIFYTANMIQEQGISVNPDWNYKLPEVYFVALMDFCFEDSQADHYVHDVRLMEINSNKQFYHKLGYLFVELPKFNKNLNELETKEDNWLFLLSNMNKLDGIPLSLNNIEIFKKLFTIAEVSNLNQEEMNAYQQSLKVHRDNYSADEYSKKEGLRKGLEEGHKEGLKEGREAGLKEGHKEGHEVGHKEGREEGAHEKVLEIARNLKKMNMSLTDIAKSTDLSIEEIEVL